MHIETEEREGSIVVVLREPRFDHAIATPFRDHVLKEAGRGLPIVIDLSHVEFMDSSGLGAVVGLRKRLGWSVRIVLAGLRSPVFRVFELAKMTGVFSFYTSVDSALSRTGADSAAWDAKGARGAAGA